MTSKGTEWGRDASLAKAPDADRTDDWVRRAQQGDRQAFDALVTTFSGRMFNLAYRMTGNREDAADLTQEIFVKLFRSIEKFAWRSSFSTWLYALAANTCRSGLRRLQRVSKVEVVQLDASDAADETYRSRESVDEGPGPVEQVAKAEVMGRVHKAIEALDEDFRMVIVLRDIQGLSYEEITAVLGCSMGTLKSRLARARLKVRDRLLKEGLTCAVTT